MSGIQILLDHLKQPEYVHVLINHAPIFGLLMSAVALFIAIVLRSRPARMTALAVVCLSAASAWPVYHYGEESYDRIKSMSDSAGEKWLDEHQRRAEEFIWAYYVLAVLAAVAIAVPSNMPRTDTALSITILVLALVTFAISGWIAFPGGQVRHKEFRAGPPPESTSEKTHE